MYRTTKRFVRGTFIALVLSAAPLTCLSAATTTSIEERAASLKPGHYVWQPDLAREGPVEIVVSIPLQIAYVYRGGTLIGASTVSTGQPGHDTPAGRFEILQKREEHYSNVYDGAPMPHMQRLTWDGIALHGGAIPGYPASHGCIRLPGKFAAKLFAATELGATVMVVDEAPSPEAAYAMLTGQDFDVAMGGPLEPIEESPALAEMAATVAALEGVE